MIEHLSKLAVHCYYAGELDAGRRAIDKALRLPDLAGDVEQQIRSNRVWYTQPLGELIPVEHHRIDVAPAHPGWSLFNPSIASDGDGMLAIVRSSNYRIDGGRYVMPDEDGDVIRTENLLCRIGWGGEIHDCRPLAVAPYATNGYPVSGLEDCRLCRLPDGWAVSATARDVERFDGRCRIAAGSLDVENAAVGQVRIFDGLSLNHHEKNWSPIEGAWSWLHSCYHDGYTVTVDPDPDMPHGWLLTRRKPAPPVARGFRGGSQLVRVGDRGWLTIVHEVAAFGNHRAYEHRFALLDDDFMLRAVTPAFALREPKAIEFAVGLAIHGDRAWVSFGLRDAEAWLVSMSAEDVCRLMVSAW